ALADRPMPHIKERQKGMETKMALTHVTRLLLAAAVSSTALVALASSPAFAQAPAQNLNKVAKVTPVTKEMLLNPSDGDWLMYRRTYNGWGYSPLDQINAANVKNLQLVWSWGMTPGGRTQETPLVHDGIIYIENSTNLLQALDGATGELIWEYQYKLPMDVTPGGERNKAIFGDNIIMATKDAHIIAVNAKTH